MQLEVSILSRCCRSVSKLSPTLCDPMQHARLPCPSLSPGACSNSHPLSLMPSNHLILCHPLLLSSIFPNIRVFSKESPLCIRWPEYWSFTLSISLSREYLGLIPFRMDWFDLVAVQGILKSLLQHYSSKASILSTISSI